MSAAVLIATSIAVLSATGQRANASPLPANCAEDSAGLVTCTFSYTGAEQQFAVPSVSGALTISAVGASGGNNFGDGNGKLGATAVASFAVGSDAGSHAAVYVGQTLYVEVGGNGTRGGQGGFNGGGAASGSPGGSGGGASDVRTTPRTTALSTDDSRLIVAGGGGGDGGCSTEQQDADGGSAGAAGLNACGHGGGGATVSAPGVAGGDGAGAGQLGQGGASSPVSAFGSRFFYTGGGGGGFYGGGGGDSLDGGGGGSSYTPDGTGIGLASAPGNGTVSISYQEVQAQVVQFATVPASARLGTSEVITASGGGSTQPVVISQDPSSTTGACTVTATGNGTASVQFARSGTCVIDANQAGEGSYAPASQAQVSVQVVPPAPIVSITTGEAPSGQCSSSVRDVSNTSQFCGDIDWLIGSGIASGYANGDFGPAVPVTRQAMAAFIYRYLHLGDGAATACASRPFPDVSTSSPFCGAIAWVKANHIALGYPDGGFHPSDPISRQAVASLAYETANPGSAASTCSSAPFPDVPTTSRFCSDIAWLAAQQLTTVYPDRGYHPVSPITRQAMAALLHRLYDNSH